MRKILTLSLFIAFGILLGVFFCQFSYFSISKEFSLSDLFIWILTSVVALYIADNIARKLAKNQAVKNLYTDDIRQLHKDLATLEDWLDEGVCDARALKLFFKNTTHRFNSIVRVYRSIPNTSNPSLTDALDLFNDLKSTVTGISPMNNGLEYRFEIGQQNQFRSDLEEIKIRLVKSMI